MATAVETAEAVTAACAATLLFALLTTRVTSTDVEASAADAASRVRDEGCVLTRARRLHGGAAPVPRERGVAVEVDYVLNPC